MLICKGWIPVTKKMPAAGFRVLLLVEDSTGKVHFDIGGLYAHDYGSEFQSWSWYTDTAWYAGAEYFDVKFWMPLPDIPDCYEEAEYEL